MIEITNLFDSYSRHARLYPALLMLLPFMLAVFAWIPDALAIGQLVVTIAITCGLLLWLADFARHRGKLVEPKLLKEWGGWPTTLWLRHSDTNLTPSIKGRYHAYLSGQPLLAPMPSADEESADLIAADERYASAVAWLKEQCRGPSFSLVQSENAVYGFRRNLLGLKPIGISICAITLLLPIAFTAINTPAEFAHPTHALLASYSSLNRMRVSSLLLSLVALVIWAFLVRRNWVKAAGNQYARALLSCCDSIKK